VLPIYGLTDPKDRPSWPVAIGDCIVNRRGMRCKTSMTRRGGGGDLDEHVAEGVLEEKRIILLFRARVFRWRHMDGNIIRLGRCSPPVARSRSRSFPTRAKILDPVVIRSRLSSWTREERERNKERGSRSRYRTLTIAIISSGIFLQEGTKTPREKKAPETSPTQGSLPITVLSVQESVSSASRTSSRGSENRVDYRVPWTRRVVLEGRAGAELSSVVEKTLNENAWCRWSATAEDHLSTTVGQGWSESVTHAYRTLDPQFPQGL